jgi:hypothetical protein
LKSKIERKIHRFFEKDVFDSYVQLIHQLRFFHISYRPLEFPNKQRNACNDESAGIRRVQLTEDRRCGR